MFKTDGKRKKKRKGASPTYKKMNKLYKNVPSSRKQVVGDFFSPQVLN